MVMVAFYILIDNFYELAPYIYICTFYHNITIEKLKL